MGTKRGLRKINYFRLSFYRKRNISSIGENMPGEKKKETDWIFNIAIAIYLIILVFVALKAFGIIDPPEIVSWQSTFTILIAIITLSVAIGRKFGIIETKIGGIDKDIDEIKIDLKDTKEKVYDIDKRLIKIEVKKKEKRG